MGAFASMAQNDYGIKLIGGVAALFSIVFSVQLVNSYQQTGTARVIDLLELASLTLLAAILAMRVFYIRFLFVEGIFGIAGLMLIAVYIQKTLFTWQSTKQKNKVLALMVLLFQSSILLYCISMTVTPFIPSLAEPAGAVGFLLAIAFFVMSFMKRKMMADGERVTGISYISRFKDKSVILFALFLLFTSYMGLTRVGIFPKMYSDEYPQAYFELVNQAEAGNEKPVDGKYRHEEFKEKYDQFVERNTASKK